MTTFSQLIDEVLAETARVDLRQSAISWLRLTIREAHLDPERNTPLFLWPNYTEVQVTADAESAYAWQIPDTTRFQGVQMIRFNSAWSDGYNPFASPFIPGKASDSQPYSYQQVGDRIIFKGYGGVGGVINIAYFQFPRPLKYYAVADRPASWDEVDGYSYHDDYDDSDELMETARERTTNWLLERWDEVMKEGLRAKIYKRLGDQQRAGTCYSLYQSLRLGLQNTENADLGGVR